MNAKTLAKYEARAHIIKALAHPARLLIVEEPVWVIYREIACIDKRLGEVKDISCPVIGSRNSIFRDSS